MKLIADTHTHTIVSHHAYSTILENAQYAKSRGLKALAVTDHGPDLCDGAHKWHFINLKVLPRMLHDVIILKGIEANIVSFDGALDVEDEILQQLDWVIAGFHYEAFPPGNIEEHTQAYIALAKNKLVDVIGHSGQARYLYDFEKVMPYFKEYDKIVEINEASPRVRAGSKENCLKIAKLCKKYEVKIIVNTDAHFAYSIGHFDQSIEMLESIDFPEHLIVNADLDRLLTYIESKKGINIKDEIK